jgi:hypothetical protein
MSSKTAGSFNNILLKLCKIVKNEYPNSLVGSNYSAIESALLNSQKDNFLLMFANNVLVNDTYIEQIEKGNDKFFTDNAAKIFADESILPIKNILDFTKMWGDLKIQEKNKIKSYLKLLLKLASKYMSEN